MGIPKELLRAPLFGFWAWLLCGVATGAALPVTTEQPVIEDDYSTPNFPAAVAFAEYFEPTLPTTTKEDFNFHDETTPPSETNGESPDAVGEGERSSPEELPDSRLAPSEGDSAPLVITPKTFKIPEDLKGPSEVPSVDQRVLSQVNSSEPNLEKETLEGEPLAESQQASKETPAPVLDGHEAEEDTPEPSTDEHGTLEDPSSNLTIFPSSPEDPIETRENVDAGSLPSLSSEDSPETPQSMFSTVFPSIWPSLTSAIFGSPEASNFDVGSLQPSLASVDSGSPGGRGDADPVASSSGPELNRESPVNVSSEEPEDLVDAEASNSSPSEGTTDAPSSGSTNEPSSETEGNEVSPSGSLGNIGSSSSENNETIPSVASDEVDTQANDEGHSGSDLLPPDAELSSISGTPLPTGRSGTLDDQLSPSESLTENGLTSASSSSTEGEPPFPSTSLDEALSGSLISEPDTTELPSNPLSGSQPSSQLSNQNDTETDSGGVEDSPPPLVDDEGAAKAQGLPAEASSSGSTDEPSSDTEGSEVSPSGSTGNISSSSSENSETLLSVASHEVDTQANEEGHSGSNLSPSDAALSSISGTPLPNFSQVPNEDGTETHSEDPEDSVSINRGETSSASSATHPESALAEAAEEPSISGDFSNGPILSPEEKRIGPTSEQGVNEEPLPDSDSTQDTANTAAYEQHLDSEDALETSILSSGGEPTAKSGTISPLVDTEASTKTQEPSGETLSSASIEGVLPNLEHEDGEPSPGVSSETLDSSPSGEVVDEGRDGEGGAGSASSAKTAVIVSNDGQPGSDFPVGQLVTSPIGGILALAPLEDVETSVTNEKPPLELPNANVETFLSTSVSRKGSPPETGAVSSEDVVPPPASSAEGAETSAPALPAVAFQPSPEGEAAPETSKETERLQTSATSEKESPLASSTTESQEHATLENGGFSGALTKESSALPVEVAGAANSLPAIDKSSQVLPESVAPSDGAEDSEDITDMNSETPSQGPLDRGSESKTSTSEEDTGGHSDGGFSLKNNGTETTMVESAAKNAGSQLPPVATTSGIAEGLEGPSGENGEEGSLIPSATGSHATSTSSEEVESADSESWTHPDSQPSLDGPSTTEVQDSASGEAVDDTYNNGEKPSLTSSATTSQSPGTSVSEDISGGISNGVSSLPAEELETPSSGSANNSEALSSVAGGATETSGMSIGVEQLESSSFSMEEDASLASSATELSRAPEDQEVPAKTSKLVSEKPGPQDKADVPLLSSKPEIPAKTSKLVSEKPGPQDKANVPLLSSKPEIPAKTSKLASGKPGLQGKVDAPLLSSKPEIPAKTSKLVSEKPGPQDKADVPLLSSKPEIPAKTSKLVSEKPGPQDKANVPLLSSKPEIPAKTSKLASGKPGLQGKVDAPLLSSKPEIPAKTSKLVSEKPGPQDKADVPLLSSKPEIPAKTSKLASGKPGLQGKVDVPLLSSKPEIPAKTSKLASGKPGLQGKVDVPLLSSKPEIPAKTSKLASGKPGLQGKVDVPLLSSKPEIPAKTSKLVSGKPGPQDKADVPLLSSKPEIPAKTSKLASGKPGLQGKVDVPLLSSKPEIPAKTSKLASGKPGLQGKVDVPLLSSKPEIPAKTSKLVSGKPGPQDKADVPLLSSKPEIPAKTSKLASGKPGLQGKVDAPLLSSKTEVPVESSQLPSGKSGLELRGDAPLLSSKTDVPVETSPLPSGKSGLELRGDAPLLSFKNDVLGNSDHLLPGQLHPASSESSSSSEEKDGDSSSGPNFSEEHQTLIKGKVALDLSKTQPDESEPGVRLALSGVGLLAAKSSEVTSKKARKKSNLKKSKTRPDKNSAIITGAPSAVSLYPYGDGVNDKRYVERKVDFNSPLFKPEIGIPLGNTLHDALYFTDNGQIIFPASDKDISSYPNPPPGGFNGREKVPMVAVFWDNADFSKGSGAIFYQEYPCGNSARHPLVQDVEAKIRRYIRSSYRARWLLKVTWDKVQPYPGKKESSKTNTYQAVLTTDGYRTYALFLYRDGGMQWDYTKLSARNVLIGYTSGDGYFKNDNLMMRTPAEKYRPDHFQGYNTDVRGLWIYKLDSRIRMNYRQKCLDWLSHERLPSAWNRNLPPCPCSLQQGLSDGRYTTSQRGGQNAGLALLYSSRPNSYGSGVRCVYNKNGQLQEGRQERIWKKSRKNFPNYDEELKLHDWCCNKAGNPLFCDKYDQKRPRIGCQGYRPPNQG